MCNKEENFDLLDLPGSWDHFVILILKIVTIFVDTGTTMTVCRIHLKFGVWMQDNMLMCNEEENSDLLDFPGSWDPLGNFMLKILTILWTRELP